MSNGTEDRPGEKRAAKSAETPRKRAASASARKAGADGPTRRKSEETKEKLCRAMIRLLDQRPIRDIRIADVTNLASVTPPAFYFYFSDVNEAALGALEVVRAETPDWGRMIDAIEIGKGTVRQTRAFVRSFLQHWDRFYGILRLRALLAEERDLRFQQSRGAELNPLVDALERKIEEFHVHAGVEPPVPSPAIAVVIAAMLERLGPVTHLEITRAGCSRVRLVEAAVQQIIAAIAPPSLGLTMNAD